MLWGCAACACCWPWHSGLPPLPCPSYLGQQQQHGPQQQEGEEHGEQHDCPPCQLDAVCHCQRGWAACSMVPLTKQCRRACCRALPLGCASTRRHLQEQDHVIAVLDCWWPHSLRFMIYIEDSSTATPQLCFTASCHLMPPPPPPPPPSGGPSHSMLLASRPGFAGCHTQQHSVGQAKPPTHCQSLPLWPKAGASCQQAVCCSPAV